MLSGIRAQLASIGLDLDRRSRDGVAHPSTDGVLHRVPTDSDKGAKRSGWYVLREYTAENGDVLIYGRAGNWKMGAEVEIKPDGKGLSAADKKAFAERQQAAREQAKAEQQARADDARTRAERLWSRLPEQGHSPYLERKGVGAYGIRYARGGAVVVPVRRDKVLVGLQFIPADGKNKRFLTGTPKRGAYHRIGVLGQSGPILIAEGYATGASLHQATGLPVIVVFDAGNIEPVVASLRQHVRMRTLVICADDDHENEPGPNQSPEQANAGHYKAHAAAKAHDALVISPQFTDPTERSDFNDMHAEQGLKALREYVLGALEKGDTPNRPDPNWEKRLVVNKSGNCVVSPHNLSLILENDEKLAGLFRLNEFATRVEFTRKPPFGGDIRDLNDAEIMELAIWLGQPETYGMNVQPKMVGAVLGAVAERNKFHPVRDYLDSLTWDGVERVPHMLSDYFGVKKDDYSRQVGLNFMISAAARVREPGIKSDLMMVLEGKQGIYKSTAIEVLAGSDWFVATTESPDNKDFYQILQGKWLVEIEELQSFSKPLMPKIKSAISSKKDVFRPPYGLVPRAFPRHCIFVGTTNDEEYLRDPTGARRFMPVYVTGVELDALRADRDQLWAEADARFLRGECYWNLPDEAEHEREKRYMQDSWTHPIEAWLDCKGEWDYPPGAEFSSARQLIMANINDIMTFALHLDKSRQNRQEQMRVAAIIKRLGWQKAQRTYNGLAKQWVYLRPADQTDDQAVEETGDVAGF